MRKNNKTRPFAINVDGVSQTMVERRMPAVGTPSPEDEANSFMS